MAASLRLFFLVFFGMFSITAFSQTDEKSLHPKLDKYYPQPKAAEQPAQPQIAAPVKQGPPVSPAQPVIQPAQSVQTQPSVQQTLPKVAPVPEKAPSLETAPAIAAGTMTATPDTSAQKPVNAVVVQPEKKAAPVQPQQKPASIYMDTRLGSSSPLYDTYEKNSNGAGSITNQPKR